MSPEVALAFGAAALGALVALLTLLPGSRSEWRYAFAAGTLAIAGELAAGALGLRSPDPDAARRWWEVSFACAAAVPATWIAFGLSFARAEAGRLLWRARWGLGAALVLPLGLAILFRGQLLAAPPGWAGEAPFLPVGWAGYVLEVVQILAAVVVLATLERTLRASRGAQRWMIKFVVIGVCTLFALRIYLASQSLLFRVLDTRLLALSATGFLLAQLSILVAYVRTRLASVEVYLSPTALYGSLTTLLVAAYLLVVGGLAVAAARLGAGPALPLVALVLLAAFWLLAVVALSDEARHRLRLLISRHFRRPLYDYRHEWRRFTARTGATLDAHELCGSVAGWIAETLQLHAVSVWMVEESGAVVLGGSTLRSTREVGRLAETAPALVAIMEALEERTGPVAVAGLKLEELSLELPEDLQFAMLLRSGQQTVGLITHSDRSTGDAITDEDEELLRTAGEQAASRLLSVRLSERLARAREMEAFQALSAFFVHDLKNLASRLSLSLHNLPERIDDPAFRADFVATLSHSAGRIDAMCARLSQLVRRLELDLRPEDLADVVGETLGGLGDSLRGRLERRLQPLPRVPCDRAEMQKVVTNLVLNADEALANGGTITVSTGRAEGAVFVAVADDGCGMEPEFVAGSLFQPFKSTKPKGLGIGLYHTRRIVEAHGGRVEVASAPGRGSTFKVVIPLPRA